MSEPTTNVADLLDGLRALAPDAVRALAERGRRLEPPAWRGRCLHPAYLEAVASGAWSPDDEARLAVFEEQAEAALAPRVARRHRRGLRSALRAVGLSLLTRDLTVESWQPHRERLAGVWQDPAPAVRPVGEREPREREVSAQRSTWPPGGAARSPTSTARG